MEEILNRLNNTLTSAVELFKKDVEARVTKTNWESRLVKMKFFGALAITLLIGLEVTAIFQSLKTALNNLDGAVANGTQPLNQTVDSKWLVKDSSTTDQIAVIPIQGVIFNTKVGGVNMVEEVQKKLSLAAYNPKVKAVILTINTPGGGVTASDLIYHEIEAFRLVSKKPVVAFYEDVAASGGYYISAQADKIIAVPTSLVGSIGVIHHGLDLSELFKKVGVKMFSYKSGRLKDIGSSDRPPTQEEQERMQNLINYYYKRFVQIVSDGRKMTPEKIQGFEAGIFNSEEALANGLIDKIGYLEDAFAEAKSLAKIQHASLIRYETRKGFIDNLLMKTKIGSFSEMSPATFLPPVNELLYLNLELMPLMNKN